jgi:hypothetical protein
MNKQIERLYTLPFLDERIGETLEDNICYNDDDTINLKETLNYFTINLRKSADEIDKFIEAIPDDNSFVCTIQRDVAHIIIRGKKNEIKSIKEFVEKC